jgi:hypothetical protein
LIDPSRAVKRKDFLSEPDEAVSDHMMAGYKASVEDFIKKQSQK